MLQSLAANYGFGRAGVVLPNGRRTQLFAPGAKGDLVFAAGRFWDQAKNLTALEQVAPALPWPLQVAGSTLHPDGTHHAPRGVESLGELPRPELARRLASAPIYAHPARYEPFGLSVLEAALSGCALVLGDIPSLRETWGQSALFVRPDDHEGLRAAIARLIADPVRRTALAESARTRALHFTAARMSAATCWRAGMPCACTSRATPGACRTC
jgi:glycogen(starch) synthase